MSKRSAMEKEMAADSTASSRPWSASTSTTANNTDGDRGRPTAPPKALSRAKSEAWRSPYQRRPEFDRQNSGTSRRSSVSGISPTRETAVIETARTASVISFGVSPTTTMIPQRTSQTPASEMPRIPKVPRMKPNLRVHIPKPSYSRNATDLHADLHWEINAQNPRNWGPWRKWMHTIIPSALAWVFMLGASIVTPAHDAMMHKIGTSPTAVVLTLSLYLLGLAFGPVLSALGSEIFGRKSVYMICVPLYAIFILASGLLQDLAGLLICRFLAGLFASPALHLGWGTLGDVWTADEQILPLTIFTSSAFLGSTLGPVLGGYLVWEESWRWTQYVVLFALGGCLVPVMTMQETSKTAILRRRKGQSARAPVDREQLTTIIVKPLRMLVTEPIILLYSLYAAFNFGVLYAVYTAFPGVLARAEHFDLGSQGLSFLGMSVGVIIGLLFLIAYDALVYRPSVARYKEERATEEEKTLQTGRRASKTPRFSLIGPSNEHIPMDTVTSPKSAYRRSSLMNTLRRFSSAGYKNLETTQQDPKKNVNLAIAAAKYLNSIPFNEGKRIMPERILLLLNQNMEFSHLCVTLEGYKLKFDRIELAKILVDAIATQDPEHQTPEQHRRAAQAALEAAPRRHSKPLTNFSVPFYEKRKTWVPPSNVPPPEWRLWIALPASVLIAGSLFMLGWTAHQGVHWIAPVIAMCLYTFSSLAAFLGTTFYVLECYGTIHGASAISGAMMLVFLFGFAFPLFAQPMYDSLGAGLASSVFAFASIVLGLVPSVLYILGSGLRRRQSWKEGK